MQAADREDAVIQPQLVEAYRVALETRNLEIKLFWERSNYFLVLNTAVAVGFFTRGHRDRYSFVLGLLGVAIAVLWVLINLGGKFWQSRWEHRLEVLEAQLPDWPPLFSAKWPAIVADVAASFAEEYPGHSRLSRTLAALHRTAVMRKPSVSRVMTALSAIFVVFWVAVTVACGVAAF